MSLSPEVRRGGGLPFGQVVSQWVCDPRYTTNLRTLYTILVTYADIGARDTAKGKPYRPELAAQLGVSIKTLDRTLLEGECAGLLHIERRTDPSNPKLNDSSVYHLRDAEFWRGEWTDPLAPGQTAAEAASAVVAARVEAKRKAGIKPKGGRRKAEPEAPAGGVASPMTPPQTEGRTGGGGVTHDARGSDTGDARVASPMTPKVFNPVDNPSQEPTPSRPSVPSVTDVAREVRTDGGMDGGGVDLVQESGPVAAGGATAAAVAAPSQDAAAAGEVPAAGDRLGAAPLVVPLAVTPGVELLLAIGAERPELLLSGQTLRDQGLTVTGMLAEGWSAGQLRYVIAGRALPSPLRKTVGAVIAARLRAALATPPPSSVAPIPEQAAAEWDAPARHREPVLSTTDAAARPVAEATTRRVSHECQGEDGACGRPVSAEGVLCHRCAPKPVEAAPEALGDMSWEERLAAAIGAAEEAEREEYYATGQDLVDARGGI